MRWMLLIVIEVSFWLGERRMVGNDGAGRPRLRSEALASIRCPFRVSGTSSKYPQPFALLAL
jgi:hypothetical protein